MSLEAIIFWSVLVSAIGYGLLYLVIARFPRTRRFDDSRRASHIVKRW